MKMFYHSEGGKTPELVAQGGCGCSIPANIQGEVGQGSEQLDGVEDVPAHGREVD